MDNETTSSSSIFEVAAQEILVANLRSAHAMEKQVIAVLQGQLALMEEYPDLHTRVTDHIVESRDQARRLEAGLEACGSSASIIKGALLSVLGMGQSSVQGFGDDAVLKAVIADMTTEHLEISTYRTLLHLADLAGKPDLRPRLEESLREEEAMASWFDDNLDAITRRTVDIRADELRLETAEPQADATPSDGEPAPTMWQTLEAGSETDGHPQSAPQTDTGDQRNSAQVSEAPQHPDRDRSRADTDFQAPRAAHRPSDG